MALEDVFRIYELRDIYSAAENQLVKALLPENSAQGRVETRGPKLKQLFSRTTSRRLKGHVLCVSPRRRSNISVLKSRRGKHCEGMEGVIGEWGGCVPRRLKRTSDDASLPPSTLALSEPRCGTEHYEIAG